jgi:type IV fimbrial biogenesis protein FimT
MLEMSLHRPAHAGFSLIELLVTLVIAAIVLGIGVPSFKSLLQRQRMTTTANDLFAAMHLARSEAIQRGDRVDLVPADGRNWASGWVVYVDENDNHRPDAGDVVVFSHGDIPAGITISTTLSDSSAQYLAYSGTGHTRTNASGQSPQFGTWSFSQDGKVRRRIKIDFVGRPRICDPDVDAACTGTADSK